MGGPEPALDGTGTSLDHAPDHDLALTTPGEPTRRPRLVTLGETTLSVGHVTPLVLHDGPPERRMDVWISDADLPDDQRRWERVGTGIVGPDGSAAVRFKYSAGTDSLRARWTRVAVAAGQSVDVLGPELVLPVVEAWPDVVGIQEAWPGMGSIGAPGWPTFWRACVPAAVIAACPQVPGASDWQATELLAWALGAPLPEGVLATPYASETAFPGSCCLAVELPAMRAPGDTGTFDTWGQDTGATDPWSGWGGWGGGIVGRPLVVEGRPLLADASPGRSGWSPTPVAPFAPPALRSALVHGWTARALGEHASVASFARFVLDLLAMGAPADLVARACRAQGDEVRHAREAFELVATWSGEAAGPGPLDLSGVRATASARETVLAAVVEGCIEETIAAAQARAAAEAASDPALAAGLARVADDEAEHAALAWAFVRWALTRDPALAPHVRAVFDHHRLPPLVPDAGPDLSAYGLLPASAERRVAEATLASVVRPCADALLGEATCA